MCEPDPVRKRWHRWFVLAAIALAWLATGCQTAVLDTDIAQQRFDAATPPLDGRHTVAQSFSCQHPNLCEIELLPAVYETPGEGTLAWRLISADGRELAGQRIPVAAIRANTPVRLTFPAQKDSTGRTYTLSLEGTAGARVGLWRSSVNAYGGGELQVDGSADPGDLVFTTRCQYDLQTLFGQLNGGLWPGLGLLLLVAALLLLPGYVWRHGISLVEHSDPVATLALSIALSLSLIPVALLWSTVLGIQWQRTLCQVVFGLLAAYAVVRLLLTRGRELACWVDARYRWLALAMAALLGAIWVLRLAQVRDLVLPAWVDSLQHVLVTKLVMLQGQVPRSYEPLLPVTAFTYHFGFHADTAVFAWLSGLPVPEAVLLLGQVLNAACALATYLLAVRLTGRKVAGVAAAAIVGLVSYMPAYYASWGRYTQLAGLLLLPAALVTALEWLEAAQRDYRWLLSAGLLQAGLFLTHARVSIFGVCFLLVYGLFAAGTRRRSGDQTLRRELGVRSGLLGLVALGLAAPWLARLVTIMIAAVRAAPGSVSGEPSYNAVPFELLFIARNRELMALAALGAIVGLLKRRRETVWILLWCLLVVLVVNPQWLGLPSTELMNNATAIIALFLPLSILSGQAVTFVWDQTPPALARLAGREATARHMAAAVRVALVLLSTGIVLWSGWGMVSIINPDTILATADDLAAMAWIREHTAPDALFLINTRHWQLDVYTGSDGGYWISLLTGRPTLLPVLGYDYGRAEYVQHITEMAQAVSLARDAQDAQLQRILDQEQVAYIYIGAKGGALTPQMFVGDPRYRPVYSSGEVWILEVVR